MDRRMAEHLDSHVRVSIELLLLLNQSELQLNQGALALEPGAAR